MPAVNRNEESLESARMKLCGEFFEHSGIEWIVHAPNDDRDQTRAMIEHDLWNYARAIFQLLCGRENLLPGALRNARTLSVCPRH